MSEDALKLRPAELLTAALRQDAARPLVTWYDDATGDRVELSVATAANWAAKTANLLTDEGVEAVRPEPAAHWLSAVVALGAWTGGVPIGEDGDPLPGDPQAFMREVLPQPDALLLPPAAPVELPDPEVTAPAGARVLSTLPLSSYDGLAAALLLPLAAGGSVVLVVNADPARLAKRAADERCTHTAGCHVDGLPRLI
jgi:acyl-CoA synthetase (AMP-forming)/AMP-acid ligase II